MELEKRIKMMAESKMYAVTKLIRIGGSYGVIVPKLWLDCNTTEIEGDYYCGIEVVGNTLVIRPIQPGDLEGVTIIEKEKNGRRR